MGRWGDGEMERWRDGEMERWRDGEMERWRDGEMGLWGSLPTREDANLPTRQPAKPWGRRAGGAEGRRGGGPEGRRAHSGSLHSPVRLRSIQGSARPISHLTIGYDYDKLPRCLVCLALICAIVSWNTSKRFIGVMV